MTKFNQQKFTKWLIDHSSLYVNSDFYSIISDSVPHFRKVWFFNPFNVASARLTKTGLEFCTKTNEIRSYRHKITEKINLKQLLFLEKYFTSPYYIHDLHDITVLDQITSVTMIMYDNDLKQMLVDLSLHDK